MPTLTGLAPLAHGGHSGAWLEYIWTAPVLLFVIWISVTAWRDRRRGPEQPPTEDDA